MSQYIWCTISADLEVVLNPFGCGILVVEPIQTAVLTYAHPVHYVASQAVPIAGTLQFSAVSQEKYNFMVVLALIS